MKITVNEKPVEEKPIDWRKLPIGTVVGFENGAVGITYLDFSDGRRGIILVQGCEGCNYGPERLAVYEDDVAIVRVLGKLTEIIVEEL